MYFALLFSVGFARDVFPLPLIFGRFYSSGGGRSKTLKSRFGRKYFDGYLFKIWKLLALSDDVRVYKYVAWVLRQFQVSWFNNPKKILSSPLLARQSQLKRKARSSSIDFSSRWSTERTNELKSSLTSKISRNQIDGTTRGKFSADWR